jgi:hypothetical protein
MIIFEVIYIDKPEPARLKWECKALEEDLNRSFFFKYDHYPSLLDVEQSIAEQLDAEAQPEDEV